MSSRAALYSRVSTASQSTDNQSMVLRAFAAARGWTATEFVDQGQSGAKERRPQLDALLAAARARKVDVVACVKLDRLARSVHHLVAMVREFEALGVDLVVLDQAIDTTTPSGRLLFHVLAAISEFERSLVVDRVKAGLDRARSRGVKLGRPRVQVDAARVMALQAEGRSIRAIARELGVSATVVAKTLRARASNPTGLFSSSGRASTRQRETG